MISDAIMLTEQQEQIYKAEVCPYCDSETVLVDQNYIYDKSFSDKKMICCSNFPLCDSYVGTHKDNTPLGRLSNKSLRWLKKEAHNHFDRIWKEGLLTRKDAYRMLSMKLEVPLEYTHIGIFNSDYCYRVISIATLCIQGAIDVKKYKTEVMSKPGANSYFIEMGVYCFLEHRLVSLSKKRRLINQYASNVLKDHTAFDTVDEKMTYVSQLISKDFNSFRKWAIEEKGIMKNAYKRQHHSESKWYENEH